MILKLGISPVHSAFVAHSSTDSHALAVSHLSASLHGTTRNYFLLYHLYLAIEAVAIVHASPWVGISKSLLDSPDSNS